MGATSTRTKSSKEQRRVGGQTIHRIKPLTEQLVKQVVLIRYARDSLAAHSQSSIEALSSSTVINVVWIMP